MALPDLHKFEWDLKNRPGPGSSAPPVSIRAKTLDDNYKKVTLIEGRGNPRLYEVEYTKDGTRITRILPEGANQSDLLYWDTQSKQWLIFPAIKKSNILHVLGLQNGKLEWVRTQDC
jgi:hypothetical protein